MFDVGEVGFQDFELLVYFFIALALAGFHPVDGHGQVVFGSLAVEVDCLGGRDRSFQLFLVGVVFHDIMVLRGKLLLLLLLVGG